jgi:hypothetical protein
MGKKDETGGGPLAPSSRAAQPLARGLPPAATMGRSNTTCISSPHPWGVAPSRDTAPCCRTGPTRSSQPRRPRTDLLASAGCEYVTTGAGDGTEKRRQERQRWEAEPPRWSTTGGRGGGAWGAPDPRRSG